MTLSNLGAIGGEAFTPIVNPPEVATLGNLRTAFRPFWNGETFVPRSMVPHDLSYDHRVVDGVEAAKFLSRYCDILRNPELLLV